MHPAQQHHSEIVTKEEHHVTEHVTFGFWIYIMSDCVLFATLFAVFAILRNNTFGGPSGEQLFSLPFVLLETIILLTSSFTCGLAMIAAYRGHLRAVALLFGVTFLLGASFVVLEVNEFAHLIHDGNDWSRSGFLSAFFTLVGTHGLHVTVGLLWMVLLMVQTMLNGVSEKMLRRLMCLSLFWHFLDIVWIFIFSFVYLMSFI